MLFGYIFINRIQPFEAANISAAFFLCRPVRKHNCCHTFQNKFQDDISCTLAMYSYIWDSLYSRVFWLSLMYIVHSEYMHLFNFRWVKDYSYLQGSNSNQREVGFHNDICLQIHNISGSCQDRGNRVNSGGGEFSN